VRAARASGHRLRLEEGVDPELGPGEAGEEATDGVGVLGLDTVGPAGEGLGVGIPAGQPGWLTAVGVEAGERRMGEREGEGDSVASMESPRRNARSARSVRWNSTRTSACSQASRALSTRRDTWSTTMTLASLRARDRMASVRRQPSTRTRLPATGPRRRNPVSPGMSGPYSNSAKLIALDWILFAQQVRRRRG
jgi:hypothetical protein